MHRIAQKLLRPSKVSVIAVALLLLQSGCGDGPTTTQKKSATSTTKESAADMQLLDPGDAVVDDVPMSKSGAPKTNSAKKGEAMKLEATKASKPAAADAGKPAPAVSDDASSKAHWSVIIATFADTDHVARANAMKSQLMQQYPELGQVTVRRVGKGSAIVLGRFAGPDDPAARPELKRIKAIERDGRKPFAGAMLMRTTADDTSGPRKPNDLRNLREKYPNVRPMFTLQVAAWSTLGEKNADYAPMRQAAERYCAELRQKGHEAWFLHDSDSETSIVTVGHFDRRAYDPKSTLYAPDVEDLMRQFPANQLNGEPLMIPVDPKNTNGKTVPQPCRLVEVPSV